MNRGDNYGSPYIKMNKIKASIKNNITFVERYFMLFKEVAYITNIRTFRLNIRKIFTYLFSNSTGWVPKPIMLSIYINLRTIKNSTRKKISNFGDRSVIKVVDTLSEISLPNHLNVIMSCIWQHLEEKNQITIQILN